MDIATPIGIFLGFALIIASMLMGGGVGMFINVPSMMITFGGTLAATLINYPLPEILRIFKVTLLAFRRKSIIPIDTVNNIMALATKARKEGVLALEKEIKEIDDSFMITGIRLVVDGMEPQVIDMVLNSEIEFAEERHTRGQGLFETLALYAPAFGMVGTLIGLVQALKNLQDPTAIGPGMSVALLTTLYGVMFAYLIATPIARKLATVGEYEVMVRRLIIEGVKSIQQGDNPYVIEQKLKAFLAPYLREKIKRPKVVETAKTE